MSFTRLAFSCGMLLLGAAGCKDPNEPPAGYTGGAPHGTVQGPPSPYHGFTTQPSDSRAGAVMGAVKVTFKDITTNAVLTSMTDPVTLTLGGGDAAATLSGTTTVAAVSGVATFSDLRIDKAGTGYYLNATSPASGSYVAKSATFAVTP